METSDGPDPADNDTNSSVLSPESDQASTYELEEILAERMKNGRREYLIKWLNYSLGWCTWEPRESLDTPVQTLREWGAKKREIKDGHIPPFDVQIYREAKRAVKAASRKRREKRRQAREAERARRIMSLDDNSESDREPEIDASNARTEAASPAPSEPATRHSLEPDDSSALFVPLGTPPRNTESVEAMRTRVSKETVDVSSLNFDQPSTAPVSQSAATQPSSRPGQTSVLLAGGQRHHQEQQKSVRKPVAQSSKTPGPETSSCGMHQTARPSRRMISKFDQRYSEARAPDANQLELMEPSKFPKRPGELHAAISSSTGQTTKPDAKRQFSTEGATTQVSPPRKSRSSGAERRFEGRRRSLSPGPYSRRDSSATFHDSYRPDTSQHSRAYGPSNVRQRTPESDPRGDFYRPTRVLSTLAPVNKLPLEPTTDTASRPLNSPLSVEVPTNRMPIGKPEKGVVWTRNGYFFNPGEVLAHVYFGSEKRYVGPVRLCGQTHMAKKDLLASKEGEKNLEMWFKDTYTLVEYENIDERFAEKVFYCNAWMEGFRDTNSAISDMAESLRTQQCVAVYRAAKPTGLSWLAYSPSSDFRFLTHRSFRLPDHVPICLAVTSPLPPNQVIRAQAIARNLSQNIAQTPITSKAQNQTLSANMAEKPSSPADPRLRRHASSSSTHSKVLPLKGDLRQTVITNSGTESTGMIGGLDEEPSTMHLTSSDHTAVGNPSDPAISQTLQMQGHLATKSLEDFFSKGLKITFRALATLQDSTVAGIFYLHFPSNASTPDPELQLLEHLEHWLNLHSVIVLSNRNGTDWEKFRKTSKNGGVAIFHESFGDYDALRPPIWQTLWHQTNFWSIRISKPLEFPDLRYCRQGTHLQRLFSYGGAFLLTDDVLIQDLQRVAVIFHWFSNYQRSSPGANKLVFRPDLLAYLGKRLAEPRGEDNEETLLITIITWIKKINSVDSRCFESKSFDPQYLDRPNNNILCLPIPGYGNRSEASNPDIPKGLTQEERNTDHLVEAFAGWTIANIARLRRTVVITNSKNPAMLRRWKEWGHVSVLQVSEFMRSWKINEAAILERLQHGTGSSHQSGGLNSPLVTPHTPKARTPRTPREQQDSDSRNDKDSESAPVDALRGSKWRVPGRIQYPSGYK